jgi:hypothetical protein
MEGGKDKENKEEEPLDPILVDYDQLKTWATLQQNFTITFSFEHENPNIDATLKRIKNIIFMEELEVESIKEVHQRNKKTVKDLLSCYHIQEEALDENDPHDIQIKEFEGERDVKGPPLESEVISAPIKIKKVNIGTLSGPKWSALEITLMNRH